MRKTSIINRKFNRLLVLGLDYVKRKKNLTVHYYLCQCDCGNKKSIRRYDIVKGNIKSCGCIHREKSSLRMKKHGMTKTPVYRRWASMKARANYNGSNPKLSCYKSVSVSQDWQIFDNFYRDMGDPPSKEHELDRINPTGNYEKDNCRWVTASENMLNQVRNTGFYKEYVSLGTDVPYRVYRKRVKELGWDKQKAANTPKMNNQFYASPKTWSQTW